MSCEPQQVSQTAVGRLRRVRKLQTVIYKNTIQHISVQLFCPQVKSLSAVLKASAQQSSCLVCGVLHNSPCALCCLQYTNQNTDPAGTHVVRTPIRLPIEVFSWFSSVSPANSWTVPWIRPHYISPTIHQQLIMPFNSIQLLFINALSEHPSGHCYYHHIFTGIPRLTNRCVLNTWS
jgi:hypothetical protein